MPVVLRAAHGRNVGAQAAVRAGALNAHEHAVVEHDPRCVFAVALSAPAIAWLLAHCEEASRGVRARRRGLLAGHLIDGCALRF